MKNEISEENLKLLSMYSKPFQSLDEVISELLSNSPDVISISLNNSGSLQIHEKTSSPNLLLGMLVSCIENHAKLGSKEFVITELKELIERLEFINREEEESNEQE